MQPIMENVEAGPSKGGNQFIDVDAALGYKYPEFSVELRRARRRALRARRRRRARTRPTSATSQLVYELRGKGMKVLPSFGVIPAINMVFTQAKQGITAPGLNFGLDRVLHGEQYTELKRPLPTHGAS